MQQAPIFNLTATERLYFSEQAASRYKQAPQSYRLRQAGQSIINVHYAAFPELNLGMQPVLAKPREYDHSVTVPAFNAWIDRQWEKKLAEIEAKRNASKQLLGDPDIAE